MNQQHIYSLSHKHEGLITPEAYSTAWVALVPDKDDLKRPAWPEALDYLRRHQLNDGGWGEPTVYYAHERLISTLAALYALSAWKDPIDASRIARGVEALHQYALDFPNEPYDPIGFELLLPALLTKLERYDLDLPTHIRSFVYKEATAKKLMLMGSLEVDYDQPRTWWFNMEMLPEDALARIDESILDEYGSIAISTAATAAYLRALRLNGKDSLKATSFLEHVLSISGGAIGVCWPVDVFELIWSLDSFMRAGFSPTNPTIVSMLKRLARHWNASPEGLYHSHAFPIADGDDTALGYHVLRWGGLTPSDGPLLSFWHNDRLLTYSDERNPSVSANVHALSAFRHDPQDRTRRQMATHIIEWLREQIESEEALYDKWHFSPFYASSRAIPALAGWDDGLAQQCVEYLLNNQAIDGGWGSRGYSNLEETAHAVLGLVSAQKAGLLSDLTSLRLAADFLQNHNGRLPTERLWIGKTLYLPIGVVQASVFAARTILSRKFMSIPRTKFWAINGINFSGTSNVTNHHYDGKSIGTRALNDALLLSK